MLSAGQKLKPQSFFSAQYARLQQLLLSKFYRKTYKETDTSSDLDDFIDIVLDASYSKDGKVTDVR
ncbi:MAG TPA: hypothetical protein VIQ03_03595 [Gammaproteobacteria bacterium]